MKRTYSIVFVIYSCFFFITNYGYSQCSIAGTPCDDGLQCSVNDVYFSTPNGCECRGTIILINCVESGPCGPYLGTPCDDGDPCTVGDQIQPDCSCVGTQVDPNCNPNCTVGAPCDDGNPLTQNDNYDANCNCVGFTPFLDDERRPVRRPASSWGNLSGTSQEIGSSLENFESDSSFSKESANILSITPNPVINEMNIILQNEITGTAQLQIFTLDGSQVLTKTIHNLKSNTLNVHELTEGTYMVIISTDKEVYSQKFVKL